MLNNTALHRLRGRALAVALIMSFLALNISQDLEDVKYAL
jgi:hypothetical protein